MNICDDDNPFAGFFTEEYLQDFAYDTSQEELNFLTNESDSVDSIFLDEPPVLNFNSLNAPNENDIGSNSLNVPNEDDIDGDTEHQNRSIKRRRITKTLNSDENLITHNNITYKLKNIFLAGTSTQSIKEGNGITLYNYTLYRRNKIDSAKSNSVKQQLPNPSDIKSKFKRVFIAFKDNIPGIKHANNHGSLFIELHAIIEFIYRCDKKLFTHYIVKDSNNKPLVGTVDFSTHLKNFNKNKKETKVKNFRNLMNEMQKVFDNWNVSINAFIAYILNRRDGKVVLLHIAKDETYRRSLLCALIKTHYPRCTRENMAKLCIVNNIKVTIFDAFKKACGIDFILGTTTVKNYIQLLLEKIRIDFGVVPYFKELQTQVTVTNEDNQPETIVKAQVSEGFSIKNYDKLLQLAQKGALLYNNGEEKPSTLQVGADCAGIYGNSALTTCSILFHCGEYPSQTPFHLLVTDIYVGPDKADYLHEVCADNKIPLQQLKANPDNNIQKVYGNFDMGLTFDIIGSKDVCPLCNEKRNEWMEKKPPNCDSKLHEKFPFYLEQLIFDLLHGKTNITQNCILRCGAGSNSVQKRLEALFEKINLYVTFSEKPDKGDDKHVKRKVKKLNGKNCDLLLDHVDIFKDLDYISNSSKRGIAAWASICKKLKLPTKQLLTWTPDQWLDLQTEIDQFIVHVKEDKSLQIYEHMLDRHGVPVMQILLQQQISLAKCSLEVVESVNQENQIALERNMFKSNYHKYKDKLIKSYKCESLILNHVAKQVMLFDSNSYLLESLDAEALRKSIKERIAGRVIDSPNKTPREPAKKATKKKSKQSRIKRKALET